MQWYGPPQPPESGDSDTRGGASRCGRAVAWSMDVGRWCGGGLLAGGGAAAAENALHGKKIVVLYFMMTDNTDASAENTACAPACPHVESPSPAPPLADRSFGAHSVGAGAVRRPDVARPVCPCPAPAFDGEARANRRGRGARRRNQAALEQLRTAVPNAEVDASPLSARVRAAALCLLANSGRGVAACGGDGADECGWGRPDCRGSAAGRLADGPARCASWLRQPNAIVPPTSLRRQLDAIVPPPKWPFTANLLCFMAAWVVRRQSAGREGGEGGRGAQWRKRGSRVGRPEGWIRPLDTTAAPRANLCDQYAWKHTETAVSSSEESGNTRKGSVLAAKEVETQGKGSVLAAKEVKTQGKAVS